MRSDIVRRRTGCQNCRNRRRKCDETRPDCLACVRRRIACSGYQRPLVFKDVSEQAAEASKRFETARWAELIQDQQRRGQSDDGASSGSHSHDRPPDASKPPTPSSSNAQMDPIDNQLQSQLDWINPEPASLSPLPTPSECTRQDSVSAVGDGQAQEPSPQGSATSISPGQSDNTSDRRTNGITTTFSEIAGSGASLHREESLTSRDNFLDNLGDLYLWPLTSASHVLYGGFLGGATAASSVAGDPMLDESMSPDLQETLVQHFESHVAQHTPVPLSCYRQFMENDCFRYALLALAARSRVSSDDAVPLAEVDGHGSLGGLGWLYYSAALQRLMQQLHAREHGGDQLVAAALLLAYYEIQNGTPRGIRNHVSGLNALASKLDLTKPFGSELFRAWRILRYDLRFLRMPTRNSVLSLDSHDRYATFDPHLTIRDLLSQLWLMYGRFYTEITFTSGTQTCTAQTARQAARWIRSLLGRRCDFEQNDNDDFHKEDLSAASIVDQLQTISLQLDKWHSALSDSDLPRMDLGSTNSIINMASFGTVLPFKCQNGRRAHEYVLYLTCRLFCDHFKSLFTPTANAGVPGGLIAAILGIIIGSNLDQPPFTVLGLDSILIVIAYLSEGTGTISVILECVLPRLIRDAYTSISGCPNWTLVKAILRLLLREKMRGRAIRYMILNVEEDDERGNRSNPVASVVFGDYGGKGYFKDTIQPIS